jgi:hypothetical protein
MAFKLPKQIRLELVALFVLIAFVSGCYLLCSCTHKPVTEGFKVGIERGLGAGLNYMMCDGVPGNTWGGCGNKPGEKVVGRAREAKPDTNFSTGEKGDTDIENMLIFAKNEIKPECCENSQSSSYDGCVCVTKEQIDFINARGGNRTMATEF